MFIEVTNKNGVEYPLCIAVSHITCFYPTGENNDSCIIQGAIDKWYHVVESYEQVKRKIMLLRVSHFSIAEISQ